MGRCFFLRIKYDSVRTNSHQMRFQMGTQGMFSKRVCSVSQLPCHYNYKDIIGTAAVESGWIQERRAHWQQTCLFRQHALTRNRSKKTSICGKKAPLNANMAVASEGQQNKFFHWFLRKYHIDGPPTMHLCIHEHNRMQCPKQNKFDCPFFLFLIFFAFLDRKQFIKP